MIDQQRLLATLREFIATPSPQTDFDQVSGFIVDVVRPRLPLAWFDEVKIDEQGNLVAVKHGIETASPFLLCAYGATFPAESMAEAFVPREVDGTAHGVLGPAIQGRGVSEQMAALAAAVEGLWGLAESRLPIQRGLIFTTTIAGEMGSHEVVEAMTRRGDLEAASGLLAVGSNNALCLGNMGRLDVHVQVRGRACHSGDPSRGLNALEGACRVLESLRTVPLGEDPELGRSTLTPTRLETWPRVMHTVPDLAQIILDRRLVPGEEIEAALQDIVTAIRPAEPYAVEVAGGKFNYPNKVSPEAEVARATRQALLEVTGSAPVAYWRATLDAGYFTRRGISTIIFGPGDMALAHTDYELVSVRQVMEAAEIYRRVLASLCSAAP